ncbi:ankyrin repeats (3 copies) domain-containing protein [Hirsutella rhossiliensis]|uniref:Ankyrin repeats (3 copies) domain-containing protein n=1 Tax=Hirsutella rhossiliensis TaxID=111463 RepID=A0A9P8N6M9_9HYPO|nr:ankyrin repeats (3 copies) domain-containing protein [Hirsutella rhossiliensis]KAH0966764.1 ankyrin repeats (3 copies) domain-containing protein [Hirsutella rhossiliensis]
MDAQNAAESDQTRPADAPSPLRQPGCELERRPKSPTSLRASPPPRDQKPKANDATAAADAFLTARPGGDVPGDRDSDAETIVLPGKDGHSPSKARKVRQEDKSESDGEAGAPGNHLGDGAAKKRVAASGSFDKDRRPRNKEGGSSGLSSAPDSPTPNQSQQQQQQQQQQQRRSDAGLSSPSDSEQHSHHKLSSSKALLRDKLKSGERLLPHKRKAPKVESDDEVDCRKARRQRTTSPRQHRRSISTQLPSQSSNGLHFKKKRLPPPLQSTDYHSDDSSAGGSPHPRSSKLRSLATPVTADSNISPAKMAPHKKHLDAHGQTLLARACARGEYETAKQRLGERPEDLNVADYAGNTPLQIAAINGCEDIVKLLIEAGCNLDCVNYDKDTPLLDAVDNGHLGVVKLLLDAGVNPRKANVNGEEPLDRVSEDTDNADDIRAALMAARKRAGERRRTSEDRTSHHDYHDSHAPDSPRRSPAALASASTGRRSGTVRSTKTRNDLLYMPLDDKTLRQAAGRGDEETVARILQVKEGYDDPESMVAAARGGHDLVIQLLLGLGGANADPGPAPSLPSEFATPVLAAIGQENIKVIELLLEQQGFDPTRRFKGETYYEIARRRQGTNWKEEEQMLKNAYDEYKRSHKEALTTKSPGGRRERERDREDKLARRDDSKELSRIHKRNHSSPSREGEPRKKGTVPKISSPREKKRIDSLKDASHVSDREVSPAVPHKPQKAKRTESDVTGMSSEGETAKPRRKLVSKGELSRERDRQKRAIKEPASPRDSRTDEGTDKSKLSEKYHNRTKALKRDESRDHSPGEGATKRHRSSVTPDRPSDGDKDHVDGAVKRRRLDVSSRDISAKPSVTGSRKERDDGSKDGHDQRGPSHYGSGRINNIGVEKSIHVKSEDVDVPMLDIDRPEANDKANTSRIESDEDELAKKRELAEQEAKKEEERKRLEAEEKKRKLEEEEARKCEEEARKREEEARKREEEERTRKAEEERKKQEEEEARKRQEQAERERREAEEAARLQEEEKKRREEERRMKEEEERKRREEEERLRKEQVEREAAEEARRLREEEERKERERRERAHREEVERKRAAREAEQRRIREEQERIRLDKLPPLLRWLDMCANPKTTVVAEQFKRMLGARYDTIRQEANGTPAGRELWVLNTHVALLLGEKDLDLSRYTAWERAPVSSLAKLTIWRTEWTRYALISDKLWDLGRQLPGYYGDEDPSAMNFDTKERLKNAAWERFLAMDMFFVKVSDLLYTVPHIPHLRNVKLAVEYRELLESEEQAIGWKSAQKWKQDPGAERFYGFAPRNKYYVNGEMVGEDVPARHQTSKTPFPEARVPRRGLVQVFPDDPDYERICLDQGLDHLIKGPHTPPVVNGVHSSPSSQTTTPAKPVVNGANGHPTHESTNGPTATNGVTSNGVNGS